jgi:arylsulfatase A-like enzyme/Tfp pilus assembly protein PilF
MRALAAACLCATLTACGSGSTQTAQQQTVPTVRNLVIITIDTLRADRVGAYGYKAAHTPTLDRLAREGVLFTHAYAAAPITLTSHASLMTGLYPAGHGARHNGMRLDPKTPTLADTLSKAGFATGAFIAAYPLDRRFGLIKGFQTYGDRMPPAKEGRAINERPGRQVVDEAIAWLEAHRGERYFLWVHLFEPHAPYGNPADGRGLTAEHRYDEEVTEADRQAGRLLDALGSARDQTVVVAAADHGEAFGEHGEIGHSIFVYDTTLRVPLIFAGPGIPAGRTISDRAALIDVAPTVMHMVGATPFDADGIDLRPAFNGAGLPTRDLYAESFAPLLDFGWSPLHALRSDRWKYIEAPRPELFDIVNDPNEERDLSRSETPTMAALRDRVARRAASNPPTGGDIDPDVRARLQALGYAAGSSNVTSGNHVDPKDRKEEAARLAQVTSGELQGPSLERALRAVLATDPGNPQANLRLGYVFLESNRCRDAIPRFRSAIDAHLPSADAHLGLAACQASGRQFDAAAATLRNAERVEPDNPVVAANLGLVLSDGGHPKESIAPLQRALTIDPDLNQARFGLAIAFARSGRLADAASTAEDLLERLPLDAPQRSEVERLIKETKRSGSD